MQLHMILYIVAFVLWLIAATPNTIRVNLWYIGWACLLLTKII